MRLLWRYPVCIDNVCLAQTTCNCAYASRAATMWDWFPWAKTKTDSAAHNCMPLNTRSSTQAKLANLIFTRLKQCDCPVVSLLSQTELLTKLARNMRANQEWGAVGRMLGIDYKQYLAICCCNDTNCTQFYLHVKLLGEQELSLPLV